LVGIIVVLSVVLSISVDVAIPCVGHLNYGYDEIKNTQKNDSKGEKSSGKSTDIGNNKITQTKFYY
jgi:hypothetical protein